MNSLKQPKGAPGVRNTLLALLALAASSVSSGCLIGGAQKGAEYPGADPDSCDAMIVTRAQLAAAMRAEAPKVTPRRFSGFVRKVEAAERLDKRLDRCIDENCDGQ